MLRAGFGLREFREFWIIWRAWKMNRIRATFELISAEQEPKALEAELTAVRELRPIGYWNVTSFALTVLSSGRIPCGTG
jgi:hypothetical protein